jgi:hypothetical protein
MLFLHINFNHCCNHNIQGKDNGLLESTPEIHPPNLIQGQEGNFFLSLRNILLPYSKYPYISGICI